MEPEAGLEAQSNQVNPDAANSWVSRSNDVAQFDRPIAHGNGPYVYDSSDRSFRDASLSEPNFWSSQDFAPRPLTETELSSLDGMVSALAC